MRRRLAACCAAVVVALATVITPGAADPLGVEATSAREVSRAGASLVSDDGLGALRANPASLARRDATRIELGLALRDGDASFRAAGAEAAASPTIRDRGAPPLLSSLLVAFGRGPVVVAAAAYDAAAGRALPSPDDGQRAEDVVRLHPHRYGGTASRVASRGVMLGAALRVTDWLGLGAALHLDEVEVAETRTLWAGFAGRDVVGDPARDLALALTARDRLRIGGALGVLIAPPDLPLELALAVRGRGAIRAEGSVDLAIAHVGDGPTPELDDPRGRLLLRAPLVMAAGLRYLGDRLTVEAGAELSRLDGRARAPRWQLDGVAVRDDSGQLARLAEVPSLLSQRGRLAARAAVDVEIARGWIWLTAGYGYAAAATAAPRLAPAAGDVGGHTLALGLEAGWDGVGVTLGYARQLGGARSVEAAASEVDIVNPFGAAAGTAAAAPGRFDAASDTVALELRLAWPG